jgi:hypothetical protein
MIRIAECAVRTVIGLATIAWAFDPAVIRAARRAPPPAPARAGLVVEVDPPAGQPSATADPSEGARQIGDAADLTRSTDGLEVQMLPDGSRRVDLQGRFRSYSVVTIAADGSLRMACADDPASALGIARAAALRAPAGPNAGSRTGRTPCGPREE